MLIDGEAVLPQPIRIDAKTSKQIDPARRGIPIASAPRAAEINKNVIGKLKAPQKREPTFITSAGTMTTSKK
jgi:hypothetical protein